MTPRGRLAEPSVGTPDTTGTEPGSPTRVALLRPPVVVMPGSLATHGPTPPLGLAYVAAALRSTGCEVQLVDGAGEAIRQCVEIDSPVGPLHRIGLSPRQVVDAVEGTPAVIGITNMFLHEWPQAREIARLARARFPGAVIVMGGENATAFAPWILAESPDVDCCVLGEGEATMTALVARVGVGAPFDDLTGVAFRDRGTGAVSDTGLSIRLKKQELPAIPRPAWDLVPLDEYWSHAPFFGVNRGRAMQVLGTRGCPYKCSFCSSPQMWTTKFVVREPDDVVDEIVGYVEQYGVENVNFVDLTAATNRRWTLGLCDALERRAPGIVWQLPVGTRTESLDAEVLRRLAETGCRNITFAPESGSPRMLEVMDKRADLDHILELIGDAREAGLRTTVNIIVGHHEERWRDVAASARYLVRAAWAGADDTATIMFCPYPGSADFATLVADGRHVVDEAALYVGLSRSSSSHRSWNPHISARQVRWLQLALISLFYSVAMVRRPRRIVEFVRNQVTGRETTYLDQMVRTRRTRIRVTGEGRAGRSSGRVPS